MKEYPDYTMNSDQSIAELIGSDFEKRKADQFRRVSREFALNPTLSNKVPTGVPVLILPFDDPVIVKLNIFKGGILLEKGEEVAFYTPLPLPSIKLDA